MNIKLSKLKYIFPILFVGFLVSCFPVSDKETRSDNSIFANIPENLTQTEKDAVIKNRQNKKLWEEKNIQNYDLEFQTNGGGLYFPILPVIIKIRNQRVEEVKSIADGKIIENTEIYERYFPVRKLFEVAESEIINKRSDVKVEYDSNISYPKVIDIHSKSLANDEDYTIKINKLNIVE